MSDSSRVQPTRIDDLTPVLRLRWEQGERPDVRQFLVDAGPLSVPQLVAVLLLDQRQRWLIGERIRAETYLSWYPALQADLEGTAELIYGEYLLREELGEAPALEEYAARFPACAERLRLQIEFHQALASDVFDPGRTDPDRTRLVAYPSEEHSPGAPHQPSVLASTWPAVEGYEILGELGRGGMGVVYKAWQTSLKRVVALKMILNDQLAGAEELARFRVEAEAVGRLQHPNVVHVYDVEAQDGRPFFSMEYVDGGSLAQKLDGTPWPSRPAAELIETLARAMQHAHRQGVVHRDLKPANVLLQKSEVRGPKSEEGQARRLASDFCPLTSDLWPKITDFGLAKLLVGGRTSTTQSSVLGTPSYMSPEQAAGKSKEVGPATDVYSLGSILYELLTGRPPFKASSLLDTLHQVCTKEPARPSLLQPKVPRDLETICLKCLEKEPRKRYASAEALADDLRRFINGEPIWARPSSTWERGLKWARRRPAAAALAGVLAAALGSLVGGILLHFDVLRERVAQAEERASRVTLRGEVEKLVGEGQLAYSRGDLHGARRQLESARDRSGTESYLADLRESAATLLDQIERTLNAQKAREAARKDFEEFKSRLDAVRFAGSNVTVQDVATNVRTIRREARKALALFQVNPEDAAPPVLNKDHFDERESAQITASCHELLVLLSGAVAHALPEEDAKAQAGQALRLLDQAVCIRPPTRDHHLRRADLLTQVGKTQEAANERRLVSALPGGSASAADHYLLGYECCQRNDPRQALIHFDDALRMEPDHFWAQFMMAVCYLRLQQPLEARDNLSACLKQKPEFVWIYLLRGFARGELGSLARADVRLPEQRRRAEAEAHFLAAEEDFRRARQMLAREPNAEAEYVLLVNRGVVRLRQGKFDLAEDDLSQAVQRKPRHYPAYLNLAKVYEEKGEIDSALARIDQAIQQGPAPALLYRARARLHLKRLEVPTSAQVALRDLDEAIAKGAAEVTPPELAAEDHVERGLILARSGRYSDAIKDYDAALSLQPDQVVVQRLRAESLFQLGQYQKAVDALDGYLAKASKSLSAFRKREEPVAAAYRLRALAKGKLGNPAAGLDDFSRSLDLEPDAPTYVLRGWLYLLHYHAPQFALPDFAEALRLDPKNADAWSGQGYARVRLGQYRKALADADKALGLDPQGSRTLFNAACIYAQAAEQVEVDRELSAPFRLGQRSRFEDQANDLLRAALTSTPASNHKKFWQEVRGASALRAIRTTPGFVRLERAYAGPAQ